MIFWLSQSRKIRKCFQLKRSVCCLPCKLDEDKTLLAAGGYSGTSALCGVSHNMGSHWVITPENCFPLVVGSYAWRIIDERENGEPESLGH